MKLDNKPHGAWVHSQISQLVIAPDTQKLSVCPQRASAALPRPSRIPGGFRTSKTEQKHQGQERHRAVCGWTKRAFWGLTEALKPVGPLQTQQRRGSSWGRRGTHLCCTPQTGPQGSWAQCALLTHTKQEKSVFVTQLSLSTVKWVKAFKHANKERKSCENATKEMPLKTLGQQIKNQTKPTNKCN